MKITNATGTYAKRISSLIRLFAIYLDATESMTRDAVSHAAALVRYFNAKHIYFSRATSKVTADTVPDDDCINIELSTYIKDGIVCCDDVVTLLFPSIDEVLRCEAIVNSNH